MTRFHPLFLGKAAALLVLSFPLAAAPAPWYLWKSKVDGALYCAQTSPGEGWVRSREAFDNPRCQPSKSTAR